MMRRLFIMKEFTMCLLLSLSWVISEAQFRIDFNGSNTQHEVLFETSATTTCSGSNNFYAGIMFEYNTGKDVLTTGFYGSNGNPGLNNKVYPINPSTVYKMDPNVEMEPVYSGGVCQGYIVAYSARSTSDIFQLVVQMYDLNGNILWTKQPLANLMESQFAREIIQIANGNFLIAGEYGFFSRDGIILEMDLIGNTLDYQTIDYGFSSQGFEDIIEVTIPLSSTKYALTGYADDFAIVVLMDASYNTNFSRLFQLPGGMNGKAIEIDGGSYYVTGQNNEISYLMKLSAFSGPGTFEGDFNWLNQILTGSNNEPFDLEVPIGGGGVVVALQSHYEGDIDYNGEGYADIIEFDPTGTVVWENSFGGNTTGGLNAFVTDLESDGSSYTISGMKWNQGAGDKNFFLADVNNTGSIGYACATPISTNQHLQTPGQDDIFQTKQSPLYIPFTLALNDGTTSQNPGLCITLPGCGSFTFHPLATFVRHDPIFPYAVIVDDVTGIDFDAYDLQHVSTSFLIIAPSGEVVYDGNEVSFELSIQEYGEYNVVHTINYLAPNGDECSEVTESIYLSEPADCELYQQEAQFSYDLDGNQLTLTDESINPYESDYVRIWSLEAPSGESITLDDTEEVQELLEETGTYTANLHTYFVAANGEDCVSFATQSIVIIPIDPCEDPFPIITYDKDERNQIILAPDMWDQALAGVEDDNHNQIVCGIQLNEKDKFEVWIEKLDYAGNRLINPKTIYSSSNAITTELSTDGIRPLILRKIKLEDRWAYALLMNRTISGGHDPHIIIFDNNLNILCSYQDSGKRSYFINDFIQHEFSEELILIGESKEGSADKLLVANIGKPCSFQDPVYKTFEKLNRGTSICYYTDNLFGITGEVKDDVFFAIIATNLKLVDLVGSDNFTIIDIANLQEKDYPRVIRYLSTGKFAIGGSTDDDDYPVFLVELNSNGVISRDAQYNHNEPNEKFVSFLEKPDGDFSLLMNVKNPNTNSRDNINFNALKSDYSLKHSQTYISASVDKNSAIDFYQTSDAGHFILGNGTPTSAGITGFLLNEIETKLIKVTENGYLEDCECSIDVENKMLDEKSSQVFIHEDRDALPLVYSNNKKVLKQYGVEEKYCIRGEGDTSCDIQTSLNAITSVGDTCCVASFDLSHASANVHRIVVSTSTPDLKFAQVTVTSPMYLNPILQNNATQAVIESVGGVPLPSSATDYLKIKYKSLSGSTTPVLQTLVFQYYNQYGQELVNCRQTIETECSDQGGDDPCVDFNFVSIECDEMVPNQYELCYTITNNLPSTTLGNIQFSAVNPAGVFFAPSSVSIIPSIAPTMTSTVQCVNLVDLSGNALPQLFDFTYFVYNAQQELCCHDTDTLQVPIPNCCDPCEVDFVDTHTVITAMDSCCQSVDLFNNCDLTLKELRFTSLTSGVNFGSIVVNPLYSSLLNVGPYYTNYFAVKNSGGGTIPSGTYNDVVEFCMDNFNGNSPQIVVIDYVMNNTIGQDSIACSDTLVLECEDDTPCLVVESDSLYCDNNGDYFVDYCFKNNSPGMTATSVYVSSTYGNPYIFVVDQATSSQTFTIPALPYLGVHCGTLKVLGNPSPHPVPGDLLDISFLLNNITGDTCCLESDTLNYILPSCSDCCEDYDGFCDLVMTGQSSHAICDTASWNVSCLDSCHFIQIDWGDGTMDTGQGVGYFEHIYNVPGTYIACATFSESSDGGNTFCWDKVVCDTFAIAPCPIKTTPCDSLDYNESMFGKVAVTCDSGSNPAGYVVGHIDVTNHQLAPINNNWSTTDYHGPAGQEWNLPNLGQVFGIAVDPKGNTYVAHTSRYVIFSGFNHFGIAGTPAIYKLDAVTGNISVLNNSLPQTNANEAGFGQIAYNIYADVLYVSNLEDGIIYVIDAKVGSVNYGQVVSTWDYGIPDLMGNEPLIGDRVNGIGFNHVNNRLYYFVENADSSDPSIPANTVYNEIRSIGVASNGHFTLTDRHEFDLPYFGNYQYSYPVTDISFSADGTKMLVTESSSISPWILNAHKSRLLEYKLSGGVYVAEPINKFSYNSFPSFSQSAAGGSDYMYGDSLFMNCDETVVSTGDAIHYTWGGPSNPQDEQIYGIIGIPASGGNINNSWMVDFDGLLTNDVDKQQIGDVEAFRKLCCGETPVLDCSSIDWSETSVTVDTTCNGNSTDVSITPNAGLVNYDWIEYDLNCDNSIELTGPAGSIYTANLPVGTHNICVTFYEVINGDTCVFPQTIQLDIESCEDCNSLDWNGTDIQLTEDCQGNQFPDITVSPIQGGVVYDWVTYDVSCDNTIESTQSNGGTYVMYPTNANLLVCATFYKVFNGDTCSYMVARDLTIEPCPSDCPNYDFMGVELALDTMCTGQLYPEIDISATNNTFDWFEVNVECDGTIEFTGQSNSIFTYSPTVPNLVICADYYKILNGDTCVYSTQQSINLDKCPGCCLDEDAFNANLGNVTVIQTGSSTFTVDCPTLTNCQELLIVWGDGASINTAFISDLPISYTYPTSGAYPLSVQMIERDNNGNKCFADDAIQQFVTETNKVEWNDLISVYPNPFHDDFAIDMSSVGQGNFDFKVIDIYGRVLMADQIVGGQIHMLTTESLISGMYILEISDESNAIFKYKMIKI